MFKRLVSLFRRKRKPPPVSSATINLGWNANPPSDNVTHYLIHRRFSSVALYTDPGIDVGTALTGSDTVTTEGTYTWAVTAQNSFGISPLSNEVTEQVFLQKGPYGTVMAI